MFKIFLKIQFRERFFIIPLLIIPLIIFSDSYIFVLIFMQKNFTNVFNNKDFNLNLMYLTGRKLGDYLLLYNLSWLVWLNQYFILTRLILMLSTSNTFITYLIDFVNFNTLLFIGFTFGNLISNSDMITISNEIVRRIITSLVFIIFISFFFAVLTINSFFDFFFINAIVLLFSFYIWYTITRRQVSITFIDYYYD